MNNIRTPLAVRSPCVMKFNDCYEIPGLPRSATQDDGKCSWRSPARKCHPPGKDPAAGSR